MPSETLSVPVPRAHCVPTTVDTDGQRAVLAVKRLGELPADGLVFPSPKGHWARRSNYRRNLFDPPPPQRAGPDEPTGAGSGRSTRCATCSPPGPLPSPAPGPDSLGEQVETIYVDIDYEILSHFSSHLYQSPNKAIEELGFDPIP